tara:strand:+ start:5675 stop:6553 length:879 start_codon:yes stop_codon:yes gene_type:complete
MMEGVKDRLLRAITSDGCYRIVVCRTDRLVADASRRHACSPLAARALARALTATALFATTDKGYYRIGVQWMGRGPLRSIHTDARPGGILRGYVGDPSSEGADIAKALGGGLIAVIRQDQAGTFTQGTLPLSSGNVDEDLEGYLCRSEQIPSRLRVVMDCDAEGRPEQVAGVLVQPLPGGAGEALLGDRGGLSRELLARSLRADQAPEELLEQVLPSEQVNILSEEPLAFSCACNQDRVERGVAMLGRDELLEMIAEGQSAEVRCDFCGEDYVVPVEGLCKLVDELEESRGN